MLFLLSTLRRRLKPHPADHQKGDTTSPNKHVKPQSKKFIPRHTFKAAFARKTVEFYAAITNFVLSKKD